MILNKVLLFRHHIENDGGKISQKLAPLQGFWRNALINYSVQMVLIKTVTERHLSL